MIYGGQPQPNGGPQRGPLVTRPLIQRPQHAPQASYAHHGPPPQSQLGSAIAGALGGMGFAMPMMGGRQQPNPAPGWNGGHMGGMHPHQHQAHGLPSYNAGAGYGPPGVGNGNYGRMQNGMANQPMPHYPSPQQPYPPQQQRFFPASSSAPLQHYPPQQQQPRMTAEGYTLSEAYTPLPPALPPLRPPGSNGLPRRPPPSNPSHQPRAGPSQPRRNDGTSTGSHPRGQTNDQGGGSGGQGGAGAVQKCSQANCKFEGSRKAVREHEEDRHLVYAPGREPKAWVPSVKSASGARIEGTNISLDSPEAIAKWIQERKKKWPTNQVAEEKDKLRAERIAAGLERAPRGGRGGRGGRGRGERGGPRGRGRGRGASSAWGEGRMDGEPQPKRLKVDHGSGSDSDSDSTLSSGSSSDDSSSDDSEDDDDDGPPLASSSKIPVPSLAGEDTTRGPSIHPSRLDQGMDGKPVEEGLEVEQKQFQVVCKWWRQGRCAQGEKCLYLHTLPPNSVTAPAPPKRKRPAPPAPPYNPFARADPFAALAEREISHVVSDVLYAVQFLANNDWLRGVELRVGQMDEEGGIEELEPSDAQSSSGVIQEVSGGVGDEAKGDGLEEEEEEELRMSELCDDDSQPLEVTELSLAGDEDEGGAGEEDYDGVEIPSEPQGLETSGYMYVEEDEGLMSFGEDEMEAWLEQD